MNILLKGREGGGGAAMDVEEEKGREEMDRREVE